ncbi:uncharacterized protein [Clytia hemisphaerica]|uniref:Glutamine amidotransferase domain-containing protein n=2 Tax=Clytia hemisphaerica TaxID=252671 RepID=A0A7M5VAJ4_9CNID
MGRQTQRVSSALRMRFGVVVTDDDPLWGGEKGVGDYIIKRFEGRNSSRDEFTAIHGVSGQLPDKKDIITYDGFIFTGSHHSVNDDSPWMRRLEVFIRNAYQTSQEFGRPRMVGICFGHQLIAKALGGHIGGNPDKKFNFGSIDINVDEGFLSNDFATQVSFKKRRKSSITMMKFHGECVLEAPKIARLIGSSEQCKNEILMYGNTVLTTQGHPEYTKNVMALTNSKIMSRIGRLDEDEIKRNLDQIVNDDAENCTDMVNAFLHHMPLSINDRMSNLAITGKNQKKNATSKRAMFKRTETIAA